MDTWNASAKPIIQPAAAREHTITLYIDKTPFRKNLGLGTEKTIYAMLVNRKGEVLWSAAGDYSAEAGDSLRRAIASVAFGSGRPMQ